MKVKKSEISYYKRAIKTAWPAVLESFFIALTGLVDTLMVSTLGTSAVSAVGLTTQPKFIGLTTFFSICVAVSAIVARRYGEKNKKSANETLLTALFASIILCIFITGLILKYSDPIIRISGSNADTHQIAKEYLDIVMGFSIFSIISMTINAAQRGSGNTKIAFTTNLVSNLVNVVFNYLLIGGNYGFPALGVKGAAIATVLGTVVAMIMSIRSLFVKSSFVRIDYIIKNKIKPTFKTAKSIANFGINMFLEMNAMRVGFLATSLIAARLGTDAFAAHNVGMQLLSIGFAFADGMQVAAVALAGSSLGAGRKEDAKLYGHICQRIGFGISVTLSLILLVFGKEIFKLFFTDETVLEYGVLISRFVTIIVMAQISQIIYAGCLRAGGDVKYTLFASLISVTFIRTIVTYVLTIPLSMGLMGIWIGVLSDQASRYVFMSTRFKKGQWVEIKIW